MLATPIGGLRAGHRDQIGADGFDMSRTQELGMESSHDKDNVDLNQRRFDVTAKPADQFVPKRGRQCKVRKFYNMELDLRVRGRAGYKFENASVLLRGQRLLGPPAGRRGFPEYPEPPRFLFDKKLGHFPRDLELCHSYWLISDRMKTALEAVDPEGFAFLQCEVRLSNGELGPVSWLCDVLRILDAVDESASRVKIEYLPQYNSKVYQLAGGADLVFKEDVIGAAHIFRLAYLKPVVFCDQQIKDACQAAGLKGVSFREFKDKA
jgi:hypothetical protein